MDDEYTILQRSERVLSGMEGQLGREIQRCFRDEGIDVVTGNDFERVRSATLDGGVTILEEGVVVETTVEGEDRRFTADELFVATGVQPNSEDIGLDTVGVETNDAVRLSLMSTSRRRIRTSMRRGTSSVNPNWRQSPRRKATPR